MQINYFPLVEEKNKKLTKEKGNLNSLAFFNDDYLIDVFYLVRFICFFF